MLLIESSQIFLILFNFMQTLHKKLFFIKLKLHEKKSNRKNKIKMILQF